MKLEDIGIIQKEQGIIKKDGIYFHTSSKFAKNNLFYLLWGAKYTCTPLYKVNRTNVFDALLFFFILDGQLDFYYRDKNFIAKNNDIVLLNNNYPNYYKATKKTTFYWFHFNGFASKQYEERFFTEHGPIFSEQSCLFFEHIHTILKEQNANDDEISSIIHQIFTQLSLYLHPKIKYSLPILKSKSYIDTHFMKDICIDDIASIAQLSKFHFLRQFHSEIGISPYTYLLKVRLDYAKKRLSESNDSIESIAESICFYSSSNFIRIFKKYMHMTPLQFRKIFIYK